MILLGVGAGLSFPPLMTLLRPEVIEQEEVREAEPVTAAPVYSEAA